MTKIIAISGGSGSGKTTTANMLSSLLGPNNCQVLSQDSYYQDQSQKFKGDGSINFDSPDAIDFSLFKSHLEKIKRGECIAVPIYNFVSHSRKIETHSLEPKEYIIVDGTLILHDNELRKLFDLILFLDIPEEIRFARRLKRDVEQRGRTPEGVRLQFETCVKPMHDFYVAPLIQYAHYKPRDDSEALIAVTKISETLQQASFSIK